MDFEYVYLQKNPYIPKLLKLGHTKNDPADRAKQLSAPTGVPGRYEVIKYWQVRDGHRWEQFIFAKLSKHNPTGEFLDLPVQSAIDKIDVLLSENGALSDFEAHKLLEAKQREKALFESERKKKLDQFWQANSGRARNEAREQAEKSLGYTEQSVRFDIQDRREASLAHRIVDAPSNVAAKATKTLDETAVPLIWLFFNFFLLFIPMIVCGIVSGVYGSNATKIADSFDNGRLRDKLIPLQRKLTDLDRETDRLFEKAKQNFYRTGYQSNIFLKPSNFGAYFTSSTSSEHERHATQAPSYSFKNKTGKPPDLILKCPFCQAKNRWTRESFVGGRIKCGSCSRQWEVDELGEEAV